MFVVIFMVVLPDGKTVLWLFYLTVKLFYGCFTLR